MRKEQFNVQSFRFKAGAFTLIELMVVFVTIMILAALLIPAASRAIAKAQRAACTGYLKQVGLAMRTWSTDHKDLYPMSSLTNKAGIKDLLAGTNAYRAFQVMSNEINNPHVLVCRSDSRRVANDFESLRNENVSYFVGLDADETWPATFLAGDRNLVTNGVEVGTGLLTLGPTNALQFSRTMHKFSGDVGLSDGSVQQVDNTTLQTLLGRTGTNVNRLIIP